MSISTIPIKSSGSRKSARFVAERLRTIRQKHDTERAEIARQNERRAEARRVKRKQEDDHKALMWAESEVQKGRQIYEIWGEYLARCGCKEDDTGAWHTYARLFAQHFIERST